jgi:hypothetical protein
VSNQFNCRPVGKADLEECLQLQPARLGAERIGLKRAMRAWVTVLNDHNACIASLVEKTTPGSGEIVGFGLAVFVSSSFADAVLANPQPGLNASIIESIDSGKSVIPSYRYLQAANACATLDHVVMYSNEKPTSLDSSELRLVRNDLARAYMDSFVGYRLRRMLYEVVEESEFEKLKGYRGIRIVRRLSTASLPGTPALWTGNRALCEATAESFSDDPASFAARPFVDRTAPILDFTPSQKRLLAAALRGAENAELAHDLCRTPAAIKRTWAGIFEKCVRHYPALLPTAEGPLRGQQKRHKVLAYIRAHPEETRPFLPQKRSGNVPKAKRPR